MLLLQLLFVVCFRCTLSLHCENSHRQNSVDHCGCALNSLLFTGAGEMRQSLRSLAALAETYMVALNNLVTPVPETSLSLLASKGNRHACNAHTYIYSNTQKFLKI